MRKNWPLLLLTIALRAQSPEQVEFFEKKVRPVLATHCFGCHSNKLPKPMANLDLSTAAGFWKGSESGPIVSKSQPAESKLIKVLEYQGSIKMPPRGKLKQEELADINSWVEMGAPWPDLVQTAIPASTSNRYQITKEQREFWSFQPARDYAVPEVKRRDWPRTPIDNFILAKLEERGLAPASQAGRLTLLRRATFDLTGLPPTPRDIDAFVSDPSGDAFAKVVDRLLASPRYGERWGRHWLDVARYADSNGTDFDIKYPYSYRYVDYVIDAFNSDLPYDQFVKEQLAGDLIPSAKLGEPNVRGIIATGFLALGPKPLTERNRVKMFYDIVDEQVSTTSIAFMGLTLGCARCHDHKFDPIPARDYYSLASIFASTKSLSKLDSEDGGRALLYFVPLVSKEVQDQYESHQAKIANKSKEIEVLISREETRFAAALWPQMARYMVAAWRLHQSTGALRLEQTARQENLQPAILERWAEFLKPSKEPAPYLERWYKAASTPASELEAIARVYQDEFNASGAEWRKQIERWQDNASAAIANGKTAPLKPALLDTKDLFFNAVMFGKRAPFALSEKDREMQFSKGAIDHLATLRAELDLLKKSSPPKPAMACGVSDGPEVKQRVFIRGNPENPGEEAPKQFPSIIAGENQTPITAASGRRELAEWLVKPDHPLTGRVMVNRIWQFHFGNGLVRTPNNFGKTGERPSHPELLDYLARRFVAGNWSVKNMHRLIMLSSAYQMSSMPTPQQLAADPENRLLSHFTRRRLDAEEIRDGLLAIEGSLDLTMGGSPQTDTGVEDTAGARRGIDLTPLKRRTIYVPIRRANLPTLLTLFDFGDATTPGEGRTRTNIGPQALFMMNSQFISDRSRGLARKLLAGAPSKRSGIESAYRLVLGREPEAQEIELWSRYLQAFRDMLPDPQMKVEDPDLQAWQSMARILIASNEFMYVD